MTQPPGNYGPPSGGYGDPYGQPGGHGDQYSQPTSGGYGQPSGPPAGSYSGAPAGYGGPPAAGYGNPPAGYGDPGQPPAGMPPAFPPGAFPPPAPRKRRTGLIIGLVAGALVLLLCGGGAVYYLIGAGGSTTAVVEAFLTTAFKERDVEAAKQYVCAKEVDDMRRELLDTGPAKLTVTWSNVRETANTGARADVSVDMVVKAELSGQSNEVKGKWVFKLVNEGGWKVCDIDTGNGGGSG